LMSARLFFRKQMTALVSRQALKRRSGRGGCSGWSSGCRGISRGLSRCGLRRINRFGKSRPRSDAPRAVSSSFNSARCRICGCGWVIRMAKGKLIEQLDDAVEGLVAKPDAPMRESDPRLAAILRIAGELRDLPRADFKDRLKAELVAQSKELAKELESAPPRAAAPMSPASSKPLITHEEIEERLKELEQQPNFIVHDVRAALSDLPD